MRTAGPVFGPSVNPGPVGHAGWMIRDLPCRRIAPPIHRCGIFAVEAIHFGLLVMGILMMAFARFAGGSFCHAHSADDSVAVARWRYAAGEIDEETYRQILRDLR